MFLGLRRRRLRRGHVPRHDARLLQGLPLPRLRLGHPRPARASRTSGRWAACREDPDDLPDVPHRDAGDRRRAAVSRASSRRTRSWRPSSTPSSRRCPGCRRSSTRSALFTAGLTAFYMFRLLALTFCGRFRGTPEQEAHIHESPASMTVPLVVLAVALGRVGLRRHPDRRSGGNRIGEFLKPIRLPIAGLHETAHHALALGRVRADGRGSVAVAALGMYLAWSWYVKGEGRDPGAPRGARSRASTARSRTSTSSTRPTRRSSCGALALGGGRAALGGRRDGRRPASPTARAP